MFNLKDKSFWEMLCSLVCFVCVLHVFSLCFSVVWGGCVLTLGVQATLPYQMGHAPPATQRLANNTYQNTACGVTLRRKRALVRGEGKNVLVKLLLRIKGPLFTASQGSILKTTS